MSRSISRTRCMGCHAALSVTWIVGGCGWALYQTLPSEMREQHKVWKQQYERKLPSSNLEIVIWEGGPPSGAVYLDGRPLDDVCEGMLLTSAALDITMSTRYLAQLSRGPHFIIVTSRGNELCERVYLGSERVTVSLGEKSGLFAQSMHETAQDFVHEYGNSPYFDDVLGHGGAFVVRTLARGDGSGRPLSLLSSLKTIASVYAGEQTSRMLRKMDAYWAAFVHAKDGRLSIARLRLLAEALNSVIGHHQRAEEFSEILKVMEDVSRGKISVSDLDFYWDFIGRWAKLSVSPDTKRKVLRAISLYSDGTIDFRALKRDVQGLL